jgi:hypothetical protein
MPRYANVVRYKHIIGPGSWDSLFAKAAEFATRIGPDRVINISHSEDMSVGVVAVWYRAEAGSVEED